MIKFSLLRTAGHIGANFATHQVKMTKLGSQSEPSRQGSSLDFRAIAEELYGPTDEIWEKKYRNGAFNLLREMEALLNIPVWSIANTCRFLEMAHFAIEVVNDADGMNHVKRLDYSNIGIFAGNALTLQGDAWMVGGNAWTSAIETIGRVSADRLAEIKTANPVFIPWIEDVTSGTYLRLIELGQLAPEGRSCPGKRSYCELRV